MTAGPEPAETGVRYEPNDRPPPRETATLALQYATLCIAGIVLGPTIIVRSAGQAESYVAWAVFAAILVSGVSTWLQSMRLWRIGAGHVLLMGTSAVFYAVSAQALIAGGPGLLATLVVASSLFQFALAARLQLLRRLFTPTVTGTVVMLIAVSVMPIVFDMLNQIPEDAAPAAGPLAFGVSLVVMVLFGLRASGAWRLWAPVVGVVAGAIVSTPLGLYDLSSVVAAPWFGLPGGWPGFDFSFGPSFWALLPAFVLVTVIGAVETIGDAVAIQRVSWRRPRAADYRVVQGAVAADGVGNLLSGLFGTVPNTTYSTSVSITELTGIASRRVGVGIGAIFVIVAFLPKVVGLIMALPGPVGAAYLLVLLAVLFVLGARLAGSGGIDYRKAIVIGVSFWIGLGFENGLIFGDQVGGWAAAFLDNGMTAGGLSAILMTAFVEWTRPRRRRLEVEVSSGAVRAIGGLLAELAARRGWSDQAKDRLLSAGEEAVLSLAALDEDADGEKAPPRRLRLVARVTRQDAELEFVAAPGGENVEDRLVVMAPEADAPVEKDLSLRLLRHVAHSVRHQQYHDTDVLTVTVNAGRGSLG